MKMFQLTIFDSQQIDGFHRFPSNGDKLSRVRAVDDEVNEDDAVSPFVSSTLP